MYTDRFWAPDHRLYLQFLYLIPLTPVIKIYKCVYFAHKVAIKSAYKDTLVSEMDTLVSEIDTLVGDLKLFKFD